jgi:hypothetical protein
METIRRDFTNRRRRGSDRSGDVQPQGHGRARGGMHLEALAFAFLASQLVLSTYAFMAYTGLVELELEMFMPMMVMLWLVGLARSWWKYR